MQIHMRSTILHHSSSRPLEDLLASVWKPSGCSKCSLDLVRNLDTTHQPRATSATYHPPAAAVTLALAAWPQFALLSIPFSQWILAVGKVDKMIIGVEIPMTSHFHTSPGVAPRCPVLLHPRIL